MIHHVAVTVLSMHPSSVGPIGGALVDFGILIGPSTVMDWIGQPKEVSAGALLN